MSPSITLCRLRQADRRALSGDRDGSAWQRVVDARIMGLMTTGGRRSGRRGSGRRGDGVAGLVLGFAGAVVLHALFLPGFGLFLQSEPSARDAAKRKQGAQMVRLSREAWEQHKRVQLEVRDAPAPDPERKKREEKKDDDVDAPGRVVSLPPPDKEERPDFADYASEWNQRTERETRSRDQEAISPSITRRKEAGTLVGDAARAAPPPQPAASGTQSSGPAGPGRAKTGDSGTDDTDGRGERLFALEVPKQAAREPLRLKLDVNGVLENREAVPEIPGTGDTARVAIGNRPADAARRSGSGGLGDEGGQGLQGGGNGSNGLPSLEQLTPSPQQLAKLAGAPANDHLPEVEVDAETRLNAWRWKHATFFNRIADAIRREWQGGEVLSNNDPGGNVYGFEDRMTVVQVTLDRGGNVLDVNVAEPSGAFVLDDEAVRAFKQAGPFANPPVQLFKREERFTFLFGFNVAYNRTNFDLNWRPN
jgi:TonB family protein